MRKKLFFVYNPKAGKALIKNKLADILDIFARAGYETTVAPTQKHGDAAAAVAQRQSDYDLVVCSGGDGTLDEVVTGIRAVSIRLSDISRRAAPMISGGACPCPRICCVRRKWL